jgi:cytoskeleton protein RodZ
MNVIEVVSAEGEQQSQVEGPGGQLRRARERLQLDLATAASQLHLAESKLRALEEDDYQQLSSPVYVQGYLRNYATLLGLSPEAMLEAYRALVPAEEPAPELKNLGVRAEVSSSNSIIRFATLGIVLMLILLPLLWWRGYLQESEQRVVTGTESLLTEITEGGGEREGARTETAPGSATGFPAAPAEAPSWTTQRRDQEPTDQSDSAAPDSVQPGRAGEAPAATEASPSAQLPRMRLVLELRESSWIELKDASGAVRLRGLLPAGTRRRLEGTPPFKVVVGNTPAVTLTVNGKQFDLERYSRQNVAKFTLDPDTINTP